MSDPVIDLPTLDNSEVVDFTAKTHVKVPVPVDPNDAARLSDIPTTHSVPAGGTIGQVLKKLSATNWDINWASVTVEATTATANTLIKRDASARSKVANPVVAGDIDNMGARDTAITAAIAASAARVLAWERCVPSAVASTVAVATFNTTTGVVTVPATTTSVRIDGVIQAGYEIMVVVSGLASTATNSLQSLWMRMSEGGTPNSASGYNEGGRWEQYDSTSGVYGANATTGFPVGHIVGPGVAFHSEIQLSPWFGGKNYFVFFKAHTATYARTTSGAGYTPAATTQFNGLYFYPGSGGFQAKIQVFRRKLMQ